MKFIGKTFLTGLVAAVPIVVISYLIYGLTVTTETVLGEAFRALPPDGWYRPGMGVGAGLLLIFFVGLLMRTRPVRRFYGGTERPLYRIPLIRSVYDAIRDPFTVFSQIREQALHQTVVLALNGMRLIGFIIRRDLRDLPATTRRCACPCVT